jgi:hypothetical protein
VCVFSQTGKQKSISISLIQSSYPQQCCRLTENCDVAVLLINCRLLEPVGSFIPDNAAFTVQTDHIIMDEIETEVHYTSLSWRWRQCLLPVIFKVTVMRTQNLIQGKIYACNPEPHRSCINRKSTLSYKATSTGIRSTLKQLPSILNCPGFGLLIYIADVGLQGTYLERLFTEDVSSRRLRTCNIYTDLSSYVGAEKTIHDKL